MERLSPGDGKVSFEYTDEISEGWEFEKTVQQRDMFSWNLSVSLETDLDAVLGLSLIHISEPTRPY